MKMLSVILSYTDQKIALHLRLIEDRWETVQSNQQEDQNCPAMQTHMNK
jgi:hypothetical protein